MTKKYRLFKGFNMIGEFKTIREAKEKAPRENGVYRLKGENYSDIWEMINGSYYGN